VTCRLPNRRAGGWPTSHQGYEPGCHLRDSLTVLSCAPLCRTPECRQAETTDPFSSKLPAILLASVTRRLPHPSTADLLLEPRIANPLWCCRTTWPPWTGGGWPRHSSQRTTPTSHAKAGCPIHRSHIAMGGSSRASATPLPPFPNGGRVPILRDSLPAVKGGVFARERANPPPKLLREPAPQSLR